MYVVSRLWLIAIWHRFIMWKRKDWKNMESDKEEYWSRDCGATCSEAKCRKEHIHRCFIQIIIWGGKFRTIHTPLVQTREAWEMQEKRAPARSLSGLAYRKRLQTSMRQVKINRKMGNAIWRFRNMWKRKNGYCTRVGIFWTENAVWYSRGSRFCRFGMRSIGKIRCCLCNAWTVAEAEAATFRQIVNSYFIMSPREVTME